ncbi:flagellar biosynthesis protein FlhB [Oricola thermophila]|uniref:Flagellar biosynthetic protein FlhB n=1 Tax=Oricola thermophila TaxID=2742145 RepID=A0A6N1VFF2_9HYPH|nr:flagellar biosynthesis protein FlhB [Oricola thermophila]QKV19656.1 flagellar biosynthesis protein FlhB [Oricola thermophila]
MAEEQDKESKTEEASEKKLQDAIEKGNTPFSKETPILFSLLATLFVAAFFMPDRITTMSQQLATIIDQSYEYRLSTSGDIYWLIQRIAVISGVTAIPLFLALVVAGIAGSAMQNTPRVVAERIKPQFSRISLTKGWQRMFSAKGFANFLNALAKIGFTSLLVALVLHDLVPRMLQGMNMETTGFLVVLKNTLFKVFATIIFSMTLIAVADWFWTRFQWKTDLRMTKQEVKDEVKQSQGDPLVKARLRSMAQDRARRRMMSAVPNASLVIANPTHLSIALRYEAGKDAAPVVVAKGQDLIALRIREIAEANGVPVFQNIELARAMYGQVSLDQMIPPEFFKAVAELISIIRRRAQNR